MACLLMLGAAAVVVVRNWNTSQPPLPQTPEDQSAVRAAWQQQQAEALNQDLLNGRTIQLLGETGAPRWYRWVTEQSRPPLELRPQEGFGVDSYDLCLLELLPRVPVPHYRLTAEVRHLRSNLGCAGLYFAAGERQTREGVENWFWRATFADRGEVAGIAKCTPYCYRERTPDRPSKEVQGSGRSKRFPVLPIDAVPPWRTLTVEVSPESVVVDWDVGQPLGTLAREELDRFARVMLLAPAGAPAPPDPAPVPAFSPHGALGLFVSKSAVNVRNVVLEPLPPP
jgi:serine/threonine-protein kinase